MSRFAASKSAPARLQGLEADDEDWRNREKWDLYEAAVEEMLLKTSTLTAPWTIVEGTDKLWHASKYCAPWSIASARSWISSRIS